MDWSFLNILKNAEFNTLMFAAAATCWILYHYHPNNEWYLGVALLCTLYCFARIVVYIYKLLSFKAQAKRTREYNKQKEEKIALDNRRQAHYVYDRMGVETQNILKNIVKTGDVSIYSDVYILRNKLEYCIMIQNLNSYLYSDNLMGEWVSIDENSDAYCVHIKYPLNDIINDCIN